MNKIIVSLVFLLSSMSLGAVSLDGTWKEDIEKTIKWNAKHRNTDSEYLGKLASISGHMYLTYKNGVMCQFYEPYTLRYKDIENKIGRYPSVNADYEVLGQNEYGFVLKFVYPDATERIDMFVYDSDESHYAVGLTLEDFGQPGFRVYMKRVPSVKWGYDCVQ